VPYGDPDPTDPNVLVGVELPADLEATRDMAWVFAEEFARMGFDAPRILGLFRSPFYAGAHQALRALGEPEVTAIIAECVGVFGPHTGGDMSKAVRAERRPSCRRHEHREASGEITGGG
jgi:hypothetical protein